MWAGSFDAVEVVATKPRRRARERKEGRFRYWKSRTVPLTWRRSATLWATLVFLDNVASLLTPRPQNLAPNRPDAVVSFWAVGSTGGHHLYHGQFEACRLNFYVRWLPPIRTPRRKTPCVSRYGVVSLSAMTVILGAFRESTRVRNLSERVCWRTCPTSCDDRCPICPELIPLRVSGDGQ